MTQVAFHRATPADVPQVMTLLRHLGRDLGDPFRMDAATLERALFGSYPAALAVIGRAPDGTAVAVALGAPVVSTMRGGVGLYISDLWVQADYRGGGLGAALLRAAAAQGAEVWNTVFLKLAVYNDNEKAQAFYADLGFIPTLGETVMTIDITKLAEWTKE